IATLEFEFDLTIPGYNTSDEYVAAIKAHQVVTTVDYTGKEFVDLAKKGDFSFVKTLPRAQIDTQKVEIVDNPDRNGAYLVIFWCGFHIQETFNVVVNLQDLTMIDEHGNPWGKWPYWINPLSYPVDKDVQETALYDWSGTRLNRNVTYMLPGKQPDYSGSVQTPIGNFSEYYLAIISPFNFQNLNATGSKEPVQVWQTVTYEPTTGLLLNSLSSHYLDDILAQKLGILRLNPSGYFWLSKLVGISFSPQEVAPSLDLTPYLVGGGVAGIAALVYWGYRRRSRR
ncbi:hypothetical protein MUP37_04110, partial [Candidatus Bathyarchaeota archaeon]|nr:hypothetical protein [Candidatus Bathyarchaeota archaeon]